MATVVALLSVVVTWAVGGSKLLLRLGAWTEKFRNLEKTTDTLDTTIREAMNKIDNDFKDIRKDIQKIFERLPEPGTVVSTSPLKLTSIGQKISEEIEASAWAEATAQELQHQVTDPTPYQIQQFCFDHVESNFAPSDELVAKAQASAYSHGVSLEAVYKVLAVELRDKLLKMHDLEPPE